MFYDKDLMNNPSLISAWKAANNIDVDLDTEVSVPNICATLDSRIDSDHEDGQNRLSLRTSSLFISGTARLYKKKLQQLFDDVENLNNEMALRNKIRCSSTCISTENSSDKSSKSDEENRSVNRLSRKENTMESSKTCNNIFPKTSPLFIGGTASLKRKLQQLFDDVENSDNEMAVRKKIRCSSTCISTENSSDKSSKSEEENRGVNWSSRKENTMESSKTCKPSASSTFTVHEWSSLFGKTPEEISPNRYPEKNDKAIQTSPIKRRSDYSAEFDEDLPFGLIIVYDSYKSRVPSKIILSSLNVNVNTLTY